MKKTILLLLISVNSILSYSQEFNKAKMDSLFMLIDQNEKGMNSVSIFKDGKEVYQNSIGYADVENQIKANKDTKYRIGSISKTFTATIIMKLVEQGRLSLDTKLSKYYPEIENAEKITIEHLLKHRSGIFNFTNAEDYVQWMEKPISKKDLVEKIKNYGSSFEPNSKADYSNANYVLLSFIAETITEKSFTELIQNEICEPCNLSNTYYGGKINTPNNEAFSYYRLDGWEKATETDMTVPVGAGAIVSNPTDLNTFLNCLFNNVIVSDSTLSKMMEIKDDYGIGMFIVPFYDKVAYGHTGGIDGFVSNAFYFPKENVSISFNSNGQVISTDNILIGALSIYFNMYYALPEFKKTIHLTSEELDKYLGTYSTPSFPLKINITKKDNVLYAQATGQSEFPLTAVGDDTFIFEAADLEIKFLPKENKLIINQGGGTTELTKE
ncbi:MAG: serine hydrolase domain-containing protein [Bacteroidia bacterium]